MIESNLETCLHLACFVFIPILQSTHSHENANFKIETKLEREEQTNMYQCNRTGSGQYH